MRWLILNLTLAILLLPTAAFACLNDREVEATEKEFKSTYMEQQAPPASPGYQEPDNKLWVLGGSGLLLLGGALTIGLRRGKA